MRTAYVYVDSSQFLKLKTMNNELIKDDECLQGQSFLTRVLWDYFGPKKITGSVSVNEDPHPETGYRSYLVNISMETCDKLAIGIPITVFRHPREEKIVFFKRVLMILISKMSEQKLGVLADKYLSFLHKDPESFYSDTPRSVIEKQLKNE